MPGSFCDGTPDNRTDYRTSRDFCQGVADRAANSGATNPYNQTEQPRAYDDWEKGKDYCASLVGQTLDRDNMICCQDGIGTVVPL